MPIYDAAIIGSGASGGITAHALTKAGLNVVMLEAGPLRKVSDFPIHKTRRWNLPFRGIRDDYFREWLDSTQFLIDDKKEPYGWEGDWFEWVRVRAVGGKSLFWAGVTPRFGPDEFQPKDDFDTRWPITYADVAPYYDKVESMIGVSSTVRPVGTFPLNNGLPPLNPKCVEVEMSKAAGKLNRGLQVIPVPKAILTRDHNGRPACHYCGPCYQGCDSGSKFDSLRVFVHSAQRTGRLNLLPGSRVRTIALNREGRAETIHYWDVAGKTYREVKAKVIILCAGTIESSQILLNSKIANSSGLAGCYLSEHLYGTAGGFLPQLMGRKVTNEDGNGAHAFIPDVTANWRGKKFLRGYQIYPTGGTGEFTFVGRNLAGFGAQWMKRIREYHTAGVSILCQGEVLPYKSNHITVDDALRDDAGIPGVRFHYQWHDNERAMFRDMMEVSEELLKAAGAEYLPIRGANPLNHGYSIHYVGTARMGDDPKTSVTNRWNQCHDVPNLFVHDAGVFVTAGNQNPTLTIMALALRSSDRMIDRLKKGEL